MAEPGASEHKRMGRGTVPPRPTQRAVVQPRRPRTTESLAHGALYTLTPDDVPFYASNNDDTWWLIGDERKFLVEDGPEGKVEELIDDNLHPSALTLDDFEPLFMYMRRCSIHPELLDDWDHRRACSASY